MAEGKSFTNQAIKIVGATTLTLAGINIQSTNGAAIEIAPNASFDVSIFLADGSENELVGQSESGGGWNGSAAIQKNGADSTGTLVIGVPNNSLGTGSLVATGGKGAAGIGGGYNSGTRNIMFTGGAVKAYAGAQSAAIGGGSEGTGIGIKLLGGIIYAEGNPEDYDKNDLSVIGSGIDAGWGAAHNMLEGDVVLTVISPGHYEVLGGFSLNRGIMFKYWLNPAFGPTYESYVFGNVTIPGSVEFPADLTIPSGQTVTIGSDVALTMASGKSITVEDGASLINASTTLAEDFPVTLNGTGTLSSEMNFYRYGATSPYLTNYQVYKTASGVQNYTNLPNPDASNAFLNWYYLNDAEQKVAIYDGDPVLLNEHNFYEERSADNFTITTQSQGEGTIQSSTTQAAAGTTVTFTLAPKDGYKVEDGSIAVMAEATPVSITAEDNLTYSFIMPASNVVISAAFVSDGPAPGPTPGPGPAPTPDVTPASDDASLLPLTGDLHHSLVSALLSVAGVGIALLGVAGILKTRRD